MPYLPPISPRILGGTPVNLLASVLHTSEQPHLNLISHLVYLSLIAHSMSTPIHPSSLLRTLIQHCFFCTYRDREYSDVICSTKAGVSYYFTLNKCIPMIGQDGMFVGVALMATCTGTHSFL